jgi:hypothetical protein
MLFHVISVLRLLLLLVAVLVVVVAGSVILAAVILVVSGWGLLVSYLPMYLNITCNMFKFEALEPSTVVYLCVVFAAFWNQTVHLSHNLQHRQKMSKDVQGSIGVRGLIILKVRQILQSSSL